MSHFRNCRGAPAPPVVLAPSPAPTCFGDPGPAAPDHGPHTPQPQTQAPPWGSMSLDHVEERLARLEKCFDDLPTRDRHRRTTSRVQDLLAREVPASDGASWKRPCADSAHPADGAGQFHLGQSAPSRGIGSTGPAGFGGKDPEVSPRVQAPPFTKVVDLSPEPSGGQGGDGFLWVPTVSFRLLYVLIVITHEQRRIVHFNLPQNPTAPGIAQQVINAFPYATAPKYLLRDRDSIYGSVSEQQVEGMGIKLDSAFRKWA